MALKSCCRSQKNHSCSFSYHTLYLSGQVVRLALKFAMRNDWDFMKAIKLYLLSAQNAVTYHEHNIFKTTTFHYGLIIDRASSDVVPAVTRKS